MVGGHVAKSAGIQPHRVKHYIAKEVTLSKQNMNSGSFDEPADELDRRIYHILSDGQKRQKEIVSLLLPSRFGEKDVRESARKLSESYPWAAEVEEQKITYYYRTDVGRVPEISKQPVDYSKIEEVLLGLEIKLGIKSQNEVGIRSPSSTIPEYLNRLLEISNYRGQVLTNEDHLARFFEVFDKMVTETKNAHSSGGPPPNYPKKNHGLFYTVVAQQHESWKSGDSHEEFDKKIQQRLGDLKILLNVVPPEIGNQIMRILAIVDIEEAREGFKKIVRSNEYNSDQLITHAEACYAVSNDINVMHNKLNMIALDCGDDDIKQKIDEIKKSTRHQI